MRGYPLRTELPTLPDVDRAELRERTTLRPDEAPGYAEWSALQLAWSRLGNDERAILSALAQRAVTGSETYGQLRIDDDRDDAQEAIEEVLDALFYAAKKLLRMRRAK